jgi:2-furoyl-CoA dehydrogenase 2Fe-2S iron sulfur subunit
MIEAKAGQKVRITLTLNGRLVAGEAEPRMQLADFLRHVLHAYGTHVGCEHGICGACTVLVEGRAVRSCLIYAVQVDGCRIETIEGLNRNTQGLTDLQEAFHRYHALQCGFCTPGILMSATQFLSEHPQPSEEDVRDMLSGHLCRCTGYAGMVEAILETARQRATKAATDH